MYVLARTCFAIIGAAFTTYAFFALLCETPFDGSAPPPFWHAIVTAIVGLTSIAGAILAERKLRVLDGRRSVEFLVLSFVILAVCVCVVIVMLLMVRD